MQKHLTEDHSLLLVIFSVLATSVFFSVQSSWAIASNASLFSWFIASLFGIYIGLVAQKIVLYSEKGVFGIAHDQLGRVLGFITGWLSWWAFTFAAVMTLTGSLQHLMPDMYLLRIFLTCFIALVFVYFWASYEPTMRHIWSGGILLVVTAFVLVLFAGINYGGSLPSIGSPKELLDGVIVSIVGFFALYLATTWHKASYEPKKELSRAVSLGSIASVVLFILIVYLSNPFAGDIHDMISYSYGHSWFVAFVLLEFSSMVIVSCLWFYAASKTLSDMASESSFVRSLALREGRARVFWFQSLAMIFLMLFGFRSYKINLEITVLLFLAVTVIALICVFRKELRLRTPEFRRNRVEIVFAIILNIAFLIFITSSSSHGYSAGKVLFGLLVLSIPVYLLFETYYNNRLVKKTNQILVHATVAFESLLYPCSFREKIFARLGLNPASTLLEFGCSVGTFTRDLVRLVKPGKVYAVDVSSLDVKFALRRVLKRHDRNIRALSDPKMYERVSQNIPKVDRVLSTDLLHNAKNVAGILRQINQKLSVKDLAVFIESLRPGDLTENMFLLLNESRLRAIFNQSGFHIKVETLHTPLCSYLVITAKKARAVNK